MPMAPVDRHAAGRLVRSPVSVRHEEEDSFRDLQDRERLTIRSGALRGTSTARATTLRQHARAISRSGHGGESWRRPDGGYVRGMVDRLHELEVRQDELNERL